MTRHPKWRRILLISLAILLALIVGGFIVFFAYTSGYARAGMRTADVYADTDLRIEDHKTYTSVQVWGQEPTVGYVFYPGGLVAADAYLPYLADVARQGYYCAVVDVPFHLAILGQNRAARVLEDNPQITTWVVGGHSLGGVAAASFAGGSSAVEGIVFLASYPTVDLSASPLQATSITATNDEVLNWGSWRDARPLLPVRTSFAEIEGGNHAGFGDYGAQKGDGEAALPPERQQREAVAHTTALLGQVAAEQEEEEALAA